jgi:hypothetical protein
MGRLSVNRLHRGLLACVTLASSLCARSSPAGDNVAASTCPRLAEVVAGLGQVLTGKPGEISPAEIQIHDYGTTWDIEVRGRVSAYSDPARDCAERARVATVFAALIVEPFDADRGAAHAPAPPIAAGSPHAARSYAVEIAPLLAFAAGAQSRNTPVGLGGQVRASLSGEHLGLSFGAEMAVFSKLDLGVYGASITRAAFDLSPRLSWGNGRLGWAAEVGPTLALLRARGAGLGENSSSIHVDAGARGALLARLRGARLAPLLALQAELGARRFDLTVEPSGSIGSAPRLWLGLLLGCVLDL